MAMNSQTLQVQMLGAFTIRLGSRTISDNDDRSHRVWSLLAYLLCNRGRAVPQQELIDLYWGDGGSSTDPGNALKSVFHRIRTSLDKLENGLGRTLILRKAGKYSWNSIIPVTVDIERFETLCREGDTAVSAAVRIASYREALELYTGDLLPKLDGEAWLAPLAKRYHEQYLRTVLSVITYCEAQKQTENVVALCRMALGIDPYQEELYEHLMRGLLLLGDNKGVMAVYEDMSDLLFTERSVMPSDTLRELYRQATRTVNDHALTMDEVQIQLQEESAAPGAMLCEYDFSASCTAPKRAPSAARATM